MSDVDPAIAPELNTIKNTRRENLSMLESFAMAGALLCVGVATRSTPLTSLLPAIAHKVAVIAGLITGISITTQFLMSKTEVESRNHDKYEQLKKTAEEYSKKLGMPKTPHIRIWKKYVPLGPATFPFLNKHTVFFNEYSLDKFSQNELNAILGHELVHAKQNHVWKTLGANMLVICASAMNPACGLLTLPLILYSCRQYELQADRIGAVVSGDPKTTASTLKRFMHDTSEKKLNDWHRSPIHEKIIKTVIAPSYTFYRGLGYLFFTPHPATERRIERLETMGNPPAKYKSDSWKNRLIRLAL